MISGGEDLKGSALEHLPRGAGSPWIPIKGAEGWGLAFYSLPR